MRARPAGPSGTTARHARFVMPPVMLLWPPVPVFLCPPVSLLWA